MASLLLLLRRLGRNPCQLHYRLLSTTTCGGGISIGEVREKEKKISDGLLSLRDRYAIDGRLLSERINSRQAILNQMINNNVDGVADKLLLKRLKELLLGEDKISTDLTNSRLTCLQQIINNLPNILRLRLGFLADDEWRKARNKLNEILMRLREIELKTFNSPLRLKEMKEMLVKEDELLAELTNSRLTCLQEIINNLSDIRTYVLPPGVDEGRLKTWNQLNERWDELNEGLIRLREMEVEDAKLLAVRTNTKLK